MQLPDGESTVYSRQALNRLPARGWTGWLAALIGIACALGVLGCRAVNEHPPGVAKTSRDEPQIKEVPESIQLSEKADPPPAPSWSEGRELEIWYRDKGKSLLLITRSNSPNRVLIHVDLHQNGMQDNQSDRVYGVGADDKIHTEYSRLPWTAAAWDETPTKAKGAERNSTASVIETMWRLPKEELGTSHDGADVAFELFNEEDQSSKFSPGVPFKSVLRLKYSLPPFEPSTNSKTASNHPLVQPSIESFLVDRELIEAGGTTTLRWVVRGAKNIKIEPGVGKFPPRGETPISPQQRTTYTLIAEGDGGSSPTRQVTVNVVPPRPQPPPPVAPVIAAFQGDANSITIGDATVLRWTVSGTVTSVRIDPGFEALPMQGQREISPAKPTQYTLTAEGPAGKASSQLTVDVIPPGRPSISFDAAPLSIIQGQTSTLQWKTKDATKVSIEPDLGDTNVSGTVLVKPLYTTRYTLTAKGRGGEVTRDITVFVSLPQNSSGQLTWTGEIHGTQLITIDKDRADVGTLSGALPGVPCIIQPVNERKVGIASAPSPSNNYERLVLRITGNGMMRVVIKWSLQ